MIRVGIGIKLLTTIAATFLLTGILTYFQPGIFCINVVSATTLRIVAIVLIAVGLVMKISSSRVPLSVFNNKEFVTTDIFLPFYVPEF